MQNVIQRVQEPTPRFFRKIRNIGLLFTALSGAMLAAPLILPAAVITVVGYIAIAGAIASAISQTAITNEGQP